MEVKLIDKMGDDIRVVNAARVSFAKESEWDISYEDSPISRDFSGMPFQEPVKHLSKQDQKLIKYLAKHEHWTPFSHVQITMREKVPIFVARQRFKHMVGFTYNEVSRRYVDDEPEFFMPTWREKAENKKQGSAEEFEPDFQNELSQIAYRVHSIALRVYNELLEVGVAPEQARMVLPQSMYTEYYVTGSLPAWARAYKLRIDGHAQKEIQDLAAMWDRQIRLLDDLKYSWEALTNEQS